MSVCMCVRLHVCASDTRVFVFVGNLNNFFGDTAYSSSPNSPSLIKYIDFQTTGPISATAACKSLSHRDILTVASMAQGKHLKSPALNKLCY